MQIGFNPYSQVNFQGTKALIRAIEKSAASWEYPNYNDDMAAASHLKEVDPEDLETRRALQGMSKKCKEAALGLACNDNIKNYLKQIFK